MSATHQGSFRRRGFITVLLAAACLFLAFTATRATVRHLSTKSELSGLEDEIGRMSRGNERLERSLERMKQPAWLALLARDRLNYKKPDETVVFVYKSEKDDTIIQPQAAVVARSNWRLWWDWVRGK